MVRQAWQEILRFGRGRKGRAPGAGCPSKCEQQFSLQDGTPLGIRPIRPEDEQALGEMFGRMSEQSLYQRFLSVPHEIDSSMLQEFCRIDYRRTMALVATVQEHSRSVIVGEGRYVREPDADFADMAFAVADAHQGRGIGKILVRCLVEVARDKGLAGFTGEVLAANSAMIHVFHAVGLSVETTQRGGAYQVRVSWRDPDGRAGRCGWLGRILRRAGRKEGGESVPPKPRVWAD